MASQLEYLGRIMLQDGKETTFAFEIGKKNSYQRFKFKLSDMAICKTCHHLVAFESVSKKTFHVHIEAYMIGMTPDGMDFFYWSVHPSRDCDIISDIVGETLHFCECNKPTAYEWSKTKKNKLESESSLDSLLG